MYMSPDLEVTLDASPLHLSEEISTNGVAEHGAGG
jgi:hypothetical protein